MRTKRTQKRRLAVQSLENRRLFAADFGIVDAPHGPAVPALIGPARPAGIECKVPVGENLGSQPGPGGTTFLTENIGGTSGPGGSTFLTKNIAGSASPGGDDILTENIGGNSGPGPRKES